MTSARVSDFAGFMYLGQLIEFDTAWVLCAQRADIWPDRYFVPGEVRGYCTIVAPSRVGGDGAMVSGAGGL